MREVASVPIRCMKIITHVCENKPIFSQRSIKLICTKISAADVIKCNTLFNLPKRHSSLSLTAVINYLAPSCMHLLDFIGLPMVNVWYS